MTSLLILAAGLLLTQDASATTYGTPKTVGSGFSQTFGVAVDASGNVFVADLGHNRVVKVAPNGTQTTVASLTNPFGVAVDSAGNLYVTEFVYQKGRLVKVAPNGAVTVLAEGMEYPSADAVNAAGDVFVAEYPANRVVEIAPNGGKTQTGGTIYSPEGITVGPGEEVFVSEAGAPGRVYKLAGSSKTTYGNPIRFPRGLVFDSAGNLFIGAEVSHEVEGVLEIAPDGTQTTIASGYDPDQLAIDGAGDIYFADANDYQVYEIPIESSKPPEYPHWYSNGTAIPAGQQVSLKTKGSVAIRLSTGTRVTCKITDADTIENPTGGGAGTDLLTSLKLGGCKATPSLCPKGQKVAAGAAGLPWSSTLQAGSPVTDKISGITIALECQTKTSRSTIDTLSGSLAPAVESGSLGFEESDRLSESIGGEATFTGSDLLTAKKKAVISAATP